MRRASTISTLLYAVAIIAAGYLFPLALMAGLVSLGLYADPQAVTA